MASLDGEIMMLICKMLAEVTVISVQGATKTPTVGKLHKMCVLSNKVVPLQFG